MKRYKVTLMPGSDFGSTLKGDMLFGQFCWAIRERYGEGRLVGYLENYTKNDPFIIFSDGFPAGYVPRPALPLEYWPEVAASERKAEKAKSWIRLDRLASNAINKIEAENISFMQERQTSHNVINRQSATVSGKQFAPYQSRQYYFDPQQAEDISRPRDIDLHILLDESRLSGDETRQLLEDIGAFGYGRDASVGLGRFRPGELMELSLPSPDQANAFLTLAPAAPQGQSWKADRCFYRPFIRFGRHGNVAAIQEKAFKKPVTLADCGAILVPGDEDFNCLFVGAGLGGVNNPVSSIMPETVQQGYAPVLAVRVEKKS